MSDTITICRPDDWHVHLRDGEMLVKVAPFTARQFGRAIVMPNLVPPITSPEAALAYRDRILAATGPCFDPLMTCYLTDNSSADDIERGFGNCAWIAAKLYPAGATTNSDSGVTDIYRIHKVLERMERIGMVLCVHGEVTDPDIDIFDREAVFIERVLRSVVRDFPSLKIVFEHITTADAADFVMKASDKVAATITPQHLIINRNAMLAGGIRPHMYCLPVAKREKHRLAVRKAAISGNPKFFLGTDSAPHARSAKESACGCAGIFNAPHALEHYLQVFEEEEAIDRFEAFASINGALFYGLPVAEETVRFEKMPTAVPDAIEGLVPFQAGGTLAWRSAG